MAVRLKDRIEANIRQSDKVNSSLSINGKTFNGSITVDAGVIGAAYGGTGQTTLINSANALINALSVGTTTPIDQDYYISQYVGGGTTTTTFHRRPHSALYTYIKNKASGTWNISVSGSANSAYQLNYYSTAGEYTKHTLAYFNQAIGNDGTAKAGVNDGPLSTNTWWHFLRFTHANSSGYYTDLAIPFGANSLYYKRINSGSVANSTINAGWIKVLDELNYTALADNNYLKLSGGQLSGPLHIACATNENMGITTTNPRIIFSENGEQPVALVYSDYDAYRNPHGLKIIGLDGEASWFEVPGYIYANSGFKSNAQDFLRSYYGNYGIIFRNDGSSFYMLVTNSGQAESGAWNDLRPLSFSLSNGDCHISGSSTSVKDAGDNTKITFNYSADGLSSTSWLAAWNGYQLRAISPSNITCGKADALTINNTANLSNCLQYIQTSEQTTGNDLPTASWWHVLKMNHGTGDTYYKRLLAFSFFSNNIKTAYASGDGVTSAWKNVWVEGDSVTGAVWNDYAEYRESDCQDFGRVLVENGDDSLSVSNFRLQPFAGISSDTWGFCQGETEKAKTPIAVAGRVLAYPYQNRENYKPGDCVCAAPNGTVDIMTRQEVVQYPDRIVGTVSCIPDYEEWGQGDRPAVKVNGRIWIKVR